MLEGSGGWPLSQTHLLHFGWRPEVREIERAKNPEVFGSPYRFEGEKKAEYANYYFSKGGEKEKMGVLMHIYTNTRNPCFFVDSPKLIQSMNNERQKCTGDPTGIRKSVCPLLSNIQQLELKCRATSKKVEETH